MRRFWQCSRRLLGVNSTGLRRETKGWELKGSIGQTQENKISRNGNFQHVWVNRREDVWSSVGRRMADLRAYPAK
jgi:hypothetical protein